MHNFFGVEVFETLVDVADIWPHLLLCHSSPFFDNFLEGPLLAELSNEIAMVDALQDFVASDGVGMIKRPGDGDLLLKKFF